MSQIRLVVGRQNQNREANLEYAKRIKAIADEKYPGLVKGIFHAHGNYNQDLGPRMILIEFGTHVTSLEEALRSVRPTAEVVAAAAGLTPGAGSGRGGAGRPGHRRMALAPGSRRRSRLARPQQRGMERPCGPDLPPPAGSGGPGG